MRRRGFIAAGGGAFAAAPLAAGAQPASRARVGFMSGSSAATAAPLLAALRAGLAERGWAEPATLELLLRFADGDPGRISANARELVAADVKVLVVSGVLGARAARDATRAIPIVIAGAIDIVGSGMVASLARPGGNVTGLSLQRMDTAPKEVELLAELVPGLARLAVVIAYTGVGVGLEVAESVRAAAATRGIETRLYEVVSVDEIDAAFATMAAAGSHAVLVIDAPLLANHRVRIVAAGLAARLPVLASSREFPEAGALAAYGANLPAVHRRAGYFVDRILRGASPADLPVEQPTVFELVINRRTATALGLTLPPSILLRADEVIE